MLEENVDYLLNTSEEMTEECSGESDAGKMMVQWYLEIDPEKKVIEIRPGDSGCISLYGAQGARNFIKAIEEAIQ